MSVIFIVVPLALLIALCALIAFIVSAHAGQFDDLDTPGVRMLLEDDGSALPGCGLQDRRDDLRQRTP